jgi:hypothetical protein
LAGHANVHDDPTKFWQDVAVTFEVALTRVQGPGMTLVVGFN